MRGFLITTAAAAMALAGCGPSDPPDYREPTDSPMASPNSTPTQDAPPDSTTGVARASGRPGVAGDTISRSSKISAPPGKSPDPRRP
jgi:hypothetical protein